MHFVAAFLAAFPFLAAALSTYHRRSTNDLNFTSILLPGLSSGASILYPAQVDYNTSTVQRATIWDPPTFAVTIKPANEKDIQYVVRALSLRSATLRPGPKLSNRSRPQIITTYLSLPLVVAMAASLALPR